MIATQPNPQSPQPIAPTQMLLSGNCLGDFSRPSPGFGILAGTAGLIQSPQRESAMPIPLFGILLADNDRVMVLGCLI